MTTFRDRVALITGAGSGIGGELARQASVHHVPGTDVNVGCAAFDRFDEELTHFLDLRR